MSLVGDDDDDGGGEEEENDYDDEALRRAKQTLDMPGKTFSTRMLLMEKEGVIKSSSLSFQLLHVVERCRS